MEFKKIIFDYLRKNHLEPVDCGTFNEESCDYNDFMIKAAEMIRDGKCQRAIGVCHTGIGSSIMANKVKGVRASLVHNEEEASLTRAHNDSNMLILGSGFLDSSKIEPILKAWLNTSFEGGRHERRVNKIKEYEQTH